VVEDDDVLECARTNTEEKAGTYYIIEDRGRL
jgi:hypothetical protein